MDMFPPGRVVFVRPIKQVNPRGRKRERKQWDTVWVQPTEIIAEGILISPRVRTPGRVGFFAGWLVGTWPFLLDDSRRHALSCWLPRHAAIDSRYEGFIGIVS